MDKIQIVPSDRSDGKGLAFLINGEDLIDIMRERGCTDWGLPMHCIGFDPVDTPLAELSENQSARCVVLVCGCGEIPCSNATVNITRRKDAVTWSDFTDGWREGPPKYSKVGPFTFDLGQYAAAMDEGRRLLREWQIATGYKQIQ